jgi:very-long-chain enoyl-CoA reductase
MLLLYSPALVAALASFAVPGAVVGARAHLLSSAIAVHFLKRILEVRKQKPKSIHVFFLYTAL